MIDYHDSCQLTGGQTCMALLTTGTPQLRGRRGLSVTIRYRPPPLLLLPLLAPVQVRCALGSSLAASPPAAAG